MGKLTRLRRVRGPYDPGKFSVNRKGEHHVLSDRQAFSKEWRGVEF